MSSPHDLVNPDALLPASGFSHAVVAASGRTVYLGGQTAHRADGSLPGGSVVEQMDQALANLRTALEAAGARTEHLVSVQIFTTSLSEYRENLGAIGDRWRQRMGRHFPALALFEVNALFDPGALVELVCIAVVPEDAATP